MSKNVGVLCKLRQVLPEKHLLMLYNSLILPYIHYCNITWASVGTTILDLCNIQITKESKMHLY